MGKLSILVITLASFHNTNAQVTSWDEGERIIGARSLGMAGAYTAFVNDATSISQNPGGLGLIPSASFSVGSWGASNFAKLQYEEFDYLDSAKSSSPFRLGFNHFAAAVKIPVKGDVSITPAISFHEDGNYRGMVETWKLVYEQNALEETFDFNWRGGRNHLSTGIGIGINDNVGIGIALNTIRGKRDYLTSIKREGWALNQPVYNESNQMGSWEGNSITWGFKYTSIDHMKRRVGVSNYGDGVDFGVSVTLPHQITYTWEEDGQELGKVFYNNPASVQTGIAFRIDNNLVTFDAAYAGYSNKWEVYEGIDFNYPTYDEQGLTHFSLAMGFEFEGVFRFGFAGRNYMYKFDNEESQPWTFTTATGFTIPISDEVLFDVGGSFEFFKWDGVIYNVSTPSQTIDRQGAVFNLFTSLRVNIF